MLRWGPMASQHMLSVWVVGIPILAALLGNPPAVTGETLLPLGDGKISNVPKVGHIYSCQSQFRGGGAHRDGEWILNNRWDPAKKISVEGDVRWSQATFSITADENSRVLTGNGLPTTHATGTFPIALSDPAYQYDRNPNRIQSQAVRFTLPLIPTVGASSQCLSMGPIGIALTGVVIFNGLDAGGRDAVAHEIQDKCDGHPERSGQYHYHGLSRCITETSDSSGHSGLVGYMLDGFGIYGVKGTRGRELTNADLDECHGHAHEVSWDGTQRILYHYHMTREYPYTIGCFRGAAVQRQRGEPRDFSGPPDRPPFPPDRPPHRPPGPPPFPPGQ